jgi:hypothetical protein
MLFGENGPFGDCMGPTARGDTNPLGGGEVIPPLLFVVESMESPAKRETGIWGFVVRRDIGI